MHAQMIHETHMIHKSNQIRGAFSLIYIPLTVIRKLLPMIHELSIADGQPTIYYFSPMNPQTIMIHDP